MQYYSILKCTCVYKYIEHTLIHITIIQAHICTYTQAHTHTYICMCTYTTVHPYTQHALQTDIPTTTQILIPTYTRTHTRTHTYIYTHSGIQVPQYENSTCRYIQYKIGASIHNLM